MSEKIYDMITNRMIQLLEKGVVPWRRPWRVGAAVNWKTQKPYRGINTLLLEPGEYASFKQVSEAGGNGEERRERANRGFLDMVRERGRRRPKK